MNFIRKIIKFFLNLPDYRTKKKVLLINPKTDFFLNPPDKSRSSSGIPLAGWLERTKLDSTNYVFPNCTWFCYFQCHHIQKKEVTAEKGLHNLLSRIFPSTCVSKRKQTSTHFIREAPLNMHAIAYNRDELSTLLKQFKMVRFDEFHLRETER